MHADYVDQIIIYKKRTTSWFVEEKMQFLFFITSIVVLVSCKPTFDEKLNNQWISFKHNYNKQYASLVEEKTR